MSLIHETRSHKPSIIMRLVKWMVTRRPEIFPKTGAGVEQFLKTREPPAEAPIPASVEKACKVDRWELEGQPCVTLHPTSGKGRQHILYFHGGGFVLPIVKEHWIMLAQMVGQLGASITVPLYNLVPEHGFADADRLADATFAKLSEEWDVSNIILSGDSAGGHMALALALRLAREGRPQAGKLCLFAPWLDVTMADPAMQAIEPHDIMLRIEALQVMGKLWASPRDPASPECSPLYASEVELEQLPPTAIFVGTHDLFVVDCRTFAEKLSAAGVATQLYEYAGAPHVFMIAVAAREAKDTFALVGQFLSD